ncbi:MAG: hypothetical protein ACOC10_10930 [Bacteroidota bacterium]
MKKLAASLLLLVVIFSCTKEETPQVAPVLPPAETMAIDFSKFGLTEKSVAMLRSNLFYAAKTVGVWNVIMGTTFAVPVAAFKKAIDHEPVNTGNSTWQWQYTVEGFTSQYTARLTGKLEASQIKWEMHISKEGVDSFDEFLWFEGTSNPDGKSGQWVLYHSAAYPEKTVQVDWKKEDVEVGEIKYSYVREKNNQGENEAFKGSTLTYGLQDAHFDVYVNVHACDIQTQQFADTNIEWNRTGFAGRVKSEKYFTDTNWHCWDSQGYDAECE